VGPQTEKLKQQQAYVNMLRSSKLPGIERVGPSNIAVRNPWDAAETAFNRAYGGYLAGKLGEDYDALAQAESAKTEAELEYQDILKQEERGFEAGQKGLDRSVQQEIAAARDATTRAEGGANRASRELVADMRIQADLQKGEPLHLMTDDGEPLTVRLDPTGKARRYTANEQQPWGEIVDISKMTPLPTSEVQMTADEFDALQAKNEKIAGLPWMVKGHVGLVTNPDLSLMGAGDVRRIIAEKTGIGPKAGEIQDLVSMTGEHAQQSIMEFLKALRPVSNIEFRTAQEPPATKEDDPIVHVNWRVRSMYVDMQSLYQEAMQEAVDNQTDVNQVHNYYRPLIKYVEEGLAAGAIMWGNEKSPEYLRTYGFPEHLVRFVQLKLEREEAIKKGLIER
jgi:hypothetical protein